MAKSGGTFGKRGKELKKTNQRQDKAEKRKNAELMGKKAKHLMK